MKEHIVPLVVTLAKAIVAEDASGVGLAGAAVPRNVPAAEDVAVGSSLITAGGAGGGGVGAAGEGIAVGGIIGGGFLPSLHVIDGL